MKPAGSPRLLTRTAIQPAHGDRAAYGHELFTNLLAALPVSGSRSAAATVAWLRRAPIVCARAIPLPAEDRDILALLLAPFFILALAIGGNQSLQLGKHVRALIARPVAPVMLPAENEAARQIATRPDAGVERLVRLNPVQPQAIADWIRAPIDFAMPRATPERAAQALANPDTLSSSRTAAGVEFEHARDVLPVSLVAPKLHPPHQVAAQPPERLIAAAMPRLLTDTAPERRMASADRQGRMLSLIGPGAKDALVAFDVERDMATQRISPFERCTLAAADAGSGAAPGAEIASSPLPIAPATWFAPEGRSSFGQRLAAAARRQLGEFIVYNDAYRRIAYPHGDVAKLYGVCTDVVIRAYRDLGIDLQVAVQNARVGSGDRNIDHRRTETLRRFFRRAGESLPVTPFAEDYLPGDIVTYARPQNTGTASRSHIAVVSDVIAPSGRPMIVHNRGWGPQLEDALFVDQITGHYRYAGPLRSEPLEGASAKTHLMTRPTADERTHPAPPKSRRTASNHAAVR